MYEACRELPGRQFEWRAFRLMDMDELAAVSRSDPLPLLPSVTKETKSALELIKESDLLLSDMEVEMLKLLAPQCMKYLGL
uniref:Uncharacterized protein n=1 Tax=Plectus sambesii TaxID=2011161 RepID=A0A914UYW1_9BILA